MSSSILPYIQAQITRYGTSTLMILGNIGNILIIILFYRRRQNACSMYLLCAAMMSNASLTFNGVMALYVLDYGDPTVRSIFLCKFRIYFGHILGQIGRYLAVVACIDRYMWTKNYAHARFMNRPTISRYIIGIVILIWLILPIHIVIFMTITNDSCGPSGIYYIIYQIYITITLGLLPPILMSLFAFLAYYNMKKLHSRIQPLGVAANNNNLVQRRDRDLLVMVLTDATVYAMTTILYPFSNIEIAITNYIDVKKSMEHRQIENLLNSIAIVLVSLSNSSRFYVYFLVSKAFPKDFKNLFDFIRFNPF